MHSAENLKNLPKNELEELIKVQRQELASKIDDLGKTAKEIIDKYAAMIRDPLGTLSSSLSHHLSSTQRWETLGIAFLAGGTMAYLSSRNHSDPDDQTKTSPLLSNLVEPLAAELIAEAQLLGHQVIRNLFHGTDIGGVEHDR